MTTLLRTDLNNFLFAPIADDSNGMHLTMLSALARAGVDPWAEAADLASLSQESAMVRVMSTLARVPNGPTPGVETETLAARLVVLLHPAPKAKPASASPAAGAATPSAHFDTQQKRVRMAIYSLVVVVLFVLGFRAVSNDHAPPPSDTSQQQGR